jgi:hypothetical protein
VQPKIRRRELLGENFRKYIEEDYLHLLTNKLDVILEIDLTAQRNMRYLHNGIPLYWEK